MKVVIVTVPMRPPHEIKPVLYPVDGNKAVEYKEPVRCPINGVLAKTLKKGEEVKVIYIMTTGKNSDCEQNKMNFLEELNGINKDIEAVLSYDTVEMDFLATKQTYNKLITDLMAKIPEKSEIYSDITYGFKPEILSLFCALRFVEDFREASVEFIVYGKVEFNKETRSLEHPMIFDITTLYYLFKLMGTMGTADSDTATRILKDFLEV